MVMVCGLAADSGRFGRGADGVVARQTTAGGARYAEAARDEFLDAVEAGLIGNDPVLRNMFTDREQGPNLGTSSEHTGPLWALELLCWAPKHLSRAAAALARLTPRSIQVDG
jgi:hypothetical protein